jgi:hypothetical protein
VARGAQEACGGAGPARHACYGKCVRPHVALQCVCVLCVALPPSRSQRGGGGAPFFVVRVRRTITHPQTPRDYDDGGRGAAGPLAHDDVGRSLRAGARAVPSVPPLYALAPHGPSLASRAHTGWPLTWRTGAVGAPRKSIAGKTVLVTGAGGGIGRELCLELARRGANVRSLTHALAGTHTQRDRHTDTSPLPQPPIRSLTSAHVRTWRRLCCGTWLRRRPSGSRRRCSGSAPVRACGRTPSTFPSRRPYSTPPRSCSSRPAPSLS